MGGGGYKAAMGLISREITENLYGIVPTSHFKIKNLVWIKLWCEFDRVDMSII